MTQPVPPRASSTRLHEPQHEPQAPPSAKESTGMRWSWVWVAPLAALALVGYLAYTFIAKRGPLIEVTFDTADGLKEGQTVVKYRAVALGTVESVELSDDLAEVVARIRMTAEAEPLLTEQARFWVVRPRLEGGLGALRTGLETLVSGTYVALDPGRREDDKVGTERRHFEGLAEPPSVRSDEPGRVYFLDGEALGGITAGAPVICREVEVGEVLSYELRNYRQVRFRIFVREPFDDWVTPETRFWNTSGLRVTTDSDGLQVQLESAQSLLSGAIAFHTPGTSGELQPSPAGATFKLYGSRAVAEIGFYEESIQYVTYFQGSVRGLSVGSEVHVLGHRMGSVTDVRITPDPRPGQEGKFAARVSYVVQPERGLQEEEWDVLKPREIHRLVDNGLRAVLETQNFVTGQKGLSLEYVPGLEASRVSGEEKVAARLANEEGVPLLPGEVRSFDHLFKSFGDVAASINSIPFSRIGKELERTLVATRKTVSSPAVHSALRSVEAAFSDVESLAEHADSGLAPLLDRLPGMAARLDQAVAQAEAALGKNGYGPGSGVHRDLERTMQQVSAAARSVRLLADLLQVQPEALLRGREGEQ